MEPTEAQRGERHFAQHLAKEHAKIIFDDLFEFASEMCLSTPVEKRAPADINPERTIVNLFGTRGIRAALEMSNPHIQLGERRRPNPDEGSEEDETPKAPQLDLDTPLLYPDLFSTELDASIQDKIRDFGEALISESYVVLGPEVDEKILAMQHATTADEQMEVIDWLDDRLVTIVRDQKDEDEPYSPPENEYAYQPYRLSPKVLGIYPDNIDSPTCLGVSIIATSFLKRAGLQTMHAGVNMSGDEMTVFTGHQFTHSVAQTAEENLGINISDPAQAAIERTTEKMQQQMTRNDAQHAAVYARLIDGTWAQFDSNYLATKQLKNGRTREFLDTMHESLESVAPYSPGVELTGVMHDPMVPTSVILSEVLQGFTSEHAAALRERAAATLGDLSEDAMAETIFQECIMPFFRPSDVSDDIKGDLLYIDLTRRDIEGTEKSESILRSTFHSMFQKYVLWGSSPAEFHERLQNDEGYLSNRIEDLTALPLMMMVAITKLEAEDFTPWYTHLLLEFGQPEYRIGAAVLSDFSLYYDFPLPPSFWMSYWPGNAGVVEHLVGDMSNHGDYVVGFNNALYHEVHPFTSFKNSGIIKSFLQENDRRGE